MSSPAPIRVLIVDDSEVVRVGLRALLATEADLQIVGEAATVGAAVTACVQLLPQVVLLDIRLPDGSGLDACRQILRRAPDTRVLILTSVIDDRLVEDAIRAGAHGYLLKEIDARRLVLAIRDVALGKSILDPAVTARVMELARTGGASPRERLADLSPQEKRVLALLAEGNTNKEIGVKLGLSDKTVKNYLSTVFEKLQVSRRAEAAALYAGQKPEA
ncbi:response regulator transcription factor [Opitutus sp. ER46]|uniref:response regulator n=1 Tax=Opitutus sp. ER46 TaxID=2161864 RepID=UPI000D32009C|nr:response regulator transcription factor [Opitutus sp. ER46]PTX99112.1 DNA-binding response regulator [Opitutus sp. ER46]